MAPAITIEHPKEHLNLNHKLRKPIVEKMRRDRINNSIEELKAFLGPQLLNQQPDSKLEKADILEMTVCLLRQQLQHKTLKPCNANQRFSRCAQEVVSFLSENQVQTQSHGTVLSHFHTLKSSSSDEDLQESAQPHLSVLDQLILSKEKSPAKSAPWRPW